MMVPGIERIFVLARNEAANIGRMLGHLAECGCPVTVLDSGSTDDTPVIVGRYSFAKVVPYRYVDHLSAYNEILTRLASRNAYCVILDADMMLPLATFKRLDALAREQRVEVVSVPVEMWWEGRPMPYGSMYPPKAILFRAGQEYFCAAGHGERLRPELAGRNVTITEPIQHDDRKGFEAYLASQVRYSNNVVRRCVQGEGSWKDRMSLSTPLIVLANPLVPLLGRFGIRCGRLGIVYAFDRMLAALIRLRVGLASKIEPLESPRSDLSSFDHGLSPDGGRAVQDPR
jgi:hypothetical protein